MAEASVSIPSPESGDSEDVVSALETATALWGIGERAEALRLLRRAAESAEEAGNDLRSVTLARAAADVASELQKDAVQGGMRSVTRPPPPPAQSASAGKPGSTPAPKAASSVPPAARPPTAPPPPAAAAPKPTAAASSSASRPKSIAPTPAPRAVTASTGTRSASVAPKPSTASSAGKAPAAAIADADGRSEPVPLVSVKTKSAPPPAAPVKADAPAVEETWLGVRVSIKVSARDPSLFVVRRLHKGQPPAPGTREALLVLLDPAIELAGVVSGETSAEKS